MRYGGKSENQNKMPFDDTLSEVPDVSTVSEFLLILNEVHPWLSFTLELEDNGKPPFLGIVIIRIASQLDTKVSVKPTDSGLCITKAMLTQSTNILN